MNILLTGATGFIGRAVILRLMRDGHRVLAWVRSPERARAQIGPSVEFVPASDDKALASALAQTDAIINLAGEPIIGGRWTERRRAALIESRVGLTRRLVQAIRAAGKRPSVLVSASAVGIYGDRGDELLTETSAHGSDFPATLCQEWEAAAREAESLGVRVALMRIGVVLGAGGGALASMLPAFRAGLGGRLGSGTQYVPWIHLYDAADLLVRAVTDSRLSGPINLVAPKPVSNRDLTAALAERLGRPAVIPVPRTALRLALGQAAGTVLASQRVIPGVLHDKGIELAFPTVEAALADILASDVRFSTEFQAPACQYLDRRGARYLLETETILDVPLDQAFPFFAQAENLALITPPSMSFEIRTPTPIPMHQGTTIDYRIKLGPVPMGWRTVIEEWQPGKLFVDSQHRGPYRAWWHEHHFSAAGDQTHMTDRVFYAPPMGPLGRMANWLMIERMLRQIFGFRSSAMALRFGRPGSPAGRTEAV